MGVRKWTEAEKNSVARNYPVHGFDMELWDEPIDRTERAIKDMASRLRVRMVPKDYEPVVSESDAQKLMAVWRKACRVIGIDEDDAYATLSLRRLR